MAFQQLGFSPYPTGPRRNLEAYKGMGQGLMQAGKGVSDMMGAFQNMKERRQKNLMALAGEERKQQAFVMDKEKYEILKAKTDADQASKKELQDYFKQIKADEAKDKELQMQMLDHEEERKNKIAIEQMRMQNIQGQPTSIPSQPQTSAMPQTPVQPQSPMAQFTPQGPVAPPVGLSPEDQQHLSRTRPTLSDIAMKTWEHGQKADPATLGLMFPHAKSGQGWKPPDEETAKRWFKFKENNKVFRPHKASSSGTQKRNRDPVFIKRKLKQSYRNRKIYKDMILSMTPNQYKTEMVDFLNRPTAIFKIHGMKRTDDMMKVIDKYIDNEDKLVGFDSDYRTYHGRDFVGSDDFQAELEEDSVGLEMHTKGMGDPLDADYQPEDGDTLGGEVKKMWNDMDDKDKKVIKKLAAKEKMTPIEYLNLSIGKK